jgi:hypothetical protein
VAKSEKLKPPRGYPRSTISPCPSGSAGRRGTRHSELVVLPTCEELGIGFVPWSPLRMGYLTRKITPEGGEQSTRPFALEGKLLGCFCEVHLPLFSFRPLRRVAVSNAAFRSEIYWRFISGFCPTESNQGRRGQTGHYVQIAQCRINTGDFASC